MLASSSLLMQVELLAFATAIIAAIVSVPLVRSLARRTGTVDAPDPNRKLHAGPIALGGGVAILLSMTLALAAAFALQHSYASPYLQWDSQWSLLMIASGAIVLLGIVDDRFTIRGRQKLLGQTVIALGIALSTQIVREVDVLGLHIELGIFAVPVTVIWLLGAINALNLIDGADGMASTVGAILAAGFAAIAAMKGLPLECAVSLALAGSLLGFLIYNRPPASIFLGDAGSMLIGLVLGVLALWGSQKEATVLAIAPLVILAVPLFDSIIAILRRVLTGRSLYDTDRGNLHHLLLERFSPGRTLLIVAMLCTLTTCSAVLSVSLQRQWIAPLGALLAVGWLVASRSFGHAEIVLLLTRLRYFIESLFTHIQQGQNHARHRTWQMQGSRSWDSLWTSLVEFADTHELARVKMDLNIAWMHEGYHGAYQRARMPDRADQVILRLPIRGHDRNVGHLEVIGNGQSPAIHEVLELLVERLKDLQPEVERLMSEMLLAHQASRTATGLGSPSAVESIQERKLREKSLT